MDGVMQNLFQQPNLPPFIATRLHPRLRHQHPSPAYITRVADVFAYGSAGPRRPAGQLRVLTDPKRAQDKPRHRTRPSEGSDAQSIGLFRTWARR